MKTIIVPTDFSPAATNATNYAVNMALQVNATLLLLHMYEIPIAITDTPLLLVSVDDLKKSAEGKLHDAKQALERITSGKLEIHTEARLGNVTDELEEVCKTVRPFAVVMGTTGSSAMERTLFGSNTLTVVRHIPYPVICVPGGKEYGEGIKKIGLACDFREVHETMPVAAIKEFIQQFPASLHILNVDYNNKQFKPDTPEQTEHVYTAFEDIKPMYHFIENADIEEGINEFAEKNNLDLVIAIPKKHRLLDGLFSKSSVKQLVFGSHVPVMCIHES